MLTSKVSFPLSAKVAKKISAAIETWFTEKNRIIVGIEGYSASRKTTIADYVAKDNNKVIVVHLDDLLKSSSERVKMMKNGSDRSKIFELKWYQYDVLNNIVEKWQSPAPASYPIQIFDYGLKKKITKTYDLTKPILLIEGIFLWHPAHAISRQFDKKVYLSVDFDKADARRDRREKKRWGEKYVDENHPDSFVKPFKVAYRRYYDTFHPEKLADLVIKI